MNTIIIVAGYKEFKALNRNEYQHTRSCIDRDMSKRILAFPMYTELTKDEQMQIIGIIKFIVMVSFFLYFGHKF